MNSLQPITSRWANPCLVILAALSLSACGGGGSSTTTSTTVYNAKTACWDGVLLNSKVSQASADALVPASCAALSAANASAITLSSALTGVGLAAQIELALGQLPAGLILAPSNLTLSSASGSTYSVSLSGSPATAVVTPALPFGQTLTVSAGQLQFINAPAVSFLGKSTFTPAMQLSPTGVISISAAPMGQTYYASTPITFGGANSVDADGSIVSYSWNLGDGSPAKSGQNISHSYANIGNYIAALTVTDNSGMTHTTSLPVWVSAIPINPVAVITLPNAGPYFVGQAVQFSPAQSQDPDGTIISYQWNFGTGNTQVGNNLPISYTYTAAGTYNVSLTVIDNSGKTHSTTVSVVVVPVPVPPVAKVALSKPPFVKNEAIGFSALASSVYNGSTIASYEWTFELGKTATGVTPAAHTFATAGEKLVTLKVTDTGGLSHTTTQTINVGTGAITDTGVDVNTCSNTAITAFVACNDATALPGQDGQFGRDSNPATNSNTDGKVGFSYSTVGNYPLTDCARDNVTGLMWEGKSAEITSPRYFGYRVANYDNPNEYQKEDNTKPTEQEINALLNSIGYANYINNIALCGYSDWRVPSVDELQSLMNYKLISGYYLTGMDTLWLKNGQPDYYVSSSAISAGALYYTLDFYSGNIYFRSRDSASLIKLVR